MHQLLAATYHGRLTSDHSVQIPGYRAVEQAIEDQVEVGQVRGRQVKLQSQG